MTTHTNQDEDERADSERKASNLDAKRKEIHSKNKGHGEIKSLETTSDTSNQQRPDRLRKTTAVDDKQIIKAVKMNPKIQVCKIIQQQAPDNLLSAGDFDTDLQRIHSKMQTSDQHQK